MEIKKIYFYSNSLNYREFSNFWQSSFELDDQKWPTSEHYYQAQKFIDFPEYMEQIRSALTPSIAKKKGSIKPWSKEEQSKLQRPVTLRKDWEQVKDEVMIKVLKAKFTQNSKLKAILLSTDNAILIENSMTDDYWGCGKNKNGQNKLGQLLMSLRQELKNNI
jgi:ribA/ribD-fused uncharacterized protein